MDVILDSNVYAQDFTLKKQWFYSLFDYLRRTGSELVLLEPVREEVIANFERRVGELRHKIANAAQSLEEMGAERPHWHGRPKTTPAVSRDVLTLNNRLHSPARDIKAKTYREYLDFDVSDVVKRGAKRIKPANDKGEELRDVVIWLMVLQYATFEDRAVAFITNDGDYWEGNVIHPQIAADIKEKAAKVELFRTVPDLLKADQPAPVSVDQEWVSKMVDVQRLQQLLVVSATTYVRELFPPYWSFRSSLVSAEYKDGSLYSVNGRPSFAELTYAFRLVIRCEDTGKANDWQGVAYAILSGGRAGLADQYKQFLIGDKILAASALGEGQVFVRFWGPKESAVDVNEIRNVRFLALNK